MEFVQPIRDTKQIEAMKRALRSGPNGLRNHLLFTLGINSGLRISDLLTLRWRDLISASKVVERIHVKEQKPARKAKYDEQGTLVKRAKPPKAKEFPVGKTTAKAVREYYTTLIVQQDDFVFLSRKGGHITRVQAWQILNDAARTVGIKDNIGTHTMRKTFGYHAYQQGQDLTLIQKLLNHSAPSVTLRYIGVTQDDLDNVYLTLNL